MPYVTLYDPDTDEPVVTYEVALGSGGGAGARGPVIEEVGGPVDRNYGGTRGPRFEGRFWGWHTTAPAPGSSDAPELQVVRDPDSLQLLEEHWLGDRDDED